MMQDNLFGFEDGVEILPPEDHDGELLSAWDFFCCIWRQRTEGKDTLTAGEHKALVRDLDKAACAALKAPARSLEGVRTKLAMALCSGPDAELFLRRFALGHRLPDLLPFSDPATCMAYDALEAVERLMAARTTH
jgi:hypothetical protein